MFWIFKKRKKDNRASRVIQHGWKVIYEKIKRMVDEIEKKIRKLKTEQTERSKLKKEIKKEKSLSVCLICTEQAKEESAMIKSEKKEKEILVEEVRRLKEENDELEEEIIVKDEELCRLEQREEKLEKKIKELQSGPSKKINVLDKKREKGAYHDLYERLRQNAKGASPVISEVRVRPEGSIPASSVARAREAEKELLSLAQDYHMARSGKNRPPKTGLLWD